jgi:hypothetical protein
MALDLAAEVLAAEVAVHAGGTTRTLPRGWQSTIRHKSVRLTGPERGDGGVGRLGLVSVALPNQMWCVWNTTSLKWERASGGQWLIARGLGDTRATL